ncbi:MAG TPA: hypothetical protein VNG51_06105 [Ktedonobacteraceae bacterium]|nr:hypothetical protein [Ktedonobacteraceae bacterium]
MSVSETGSILRKAATSGEEQPFISFNEDAPGTCLRIGTGRI